MKYVTFHHPLVPPERDSFETRLPAPPAVGTGADGQGGHGGEFVYGESVEDPAKCAGEVPILHKFLGLRPTSKPLSLRPLRLCSEY